MFSDLNVGLCVGEVPVNLDTYQYTQGWFEVSVIKNFPGYYFRWWYWLNCAIC